MAQVLIRQLDEDVVSKLKARAVRHGRSLEAELRVVLTELVQDPEAGIQEIRASFGKRTFPDSGGSIRGRS